MLQWADGLSSQAVLCIQASSLCTYCGLYGLCILMVVIFQISIKAILIGYDLIQSAFKDDN